LDEVLERGALKMLQRALEVEVEDYIARHRAARDARGRAQVVRNGKAPARRLVTGSGTLEVRAPRVNDQRVDAAGERQRFSSELLPSYMRRAPKVGDPVRLKRDIEAISAEWRSTLRSASRTARTRSGSL
jgi:hypothetical protein